MEFKRKDSSCCGSYICWVSYAFESLFASILIFFFFFNSKFKYIQCIRIVWGNVHLYPENPIIVESYPFLFLFSIVVIGNFFFIVGTMAHAKLYRSTETSQQTSHFCIVHQRRKNWILFCKCLTHKFHIKRRTELQKIVLIVIN